MDRLENLPIEDVEPDPQQLETIQRYFESAANLKKKDGRSIWSEIFITLLAMLLFFIFAMGFVDRMLLWFPYMDNSWLRLSFKTLIFGIILYVLIVLIS